MKQIVVFADVKPFPVFFAVNPETKELFLSCDKYGFFSRVKLAKRRKGLDFYPNSAHRPEKVVEITDLAFSVVDKMKTERDAHEEVNKLFSADFPQSGKVVINSIRER